LIAVTVGLVSTHHEVGEETLYRFFERNTVSGKLIAYEVIFEVGGHIAIPVDHCAVHSTCTATQTGASSAQAGVTSFKGKSTGAAGGNLRSPSPAVKNEACAG
jgi:hypothetical protein